MTVKDSSPRAIAVQSNDLADVQIYIVQLSGSVNDVPEDNAGSTLMTSTTSFTIFVNNGCTVDVIEPTSLSEDYNRTYVIGQGIAI